MICPRCKTAGLVERTTKSGIVIDACLTCKGTWLDRGKVLQFSPHPHQLDEELEGSIAQGGYSDRLCPQCDQAMEVVPFLEADLQVERCPRCEGFWFDSGKLRLALEADRRLGLVGDEEHDELAAGTSSIEPVAAGGALDDRVEARMRDLASGMIPLPSLLLRSAGVLFLLYGIMGLALITLAQFHILSAGLAVAIGAGIIVVQFALGPWLMDLALRWIYKFSWLDPDELPDHLREFVERVCQEKNMKVPSFGLIHDGAPNAFTYGHTPRNMRVVFTQGILDLLEPAEVESVVAHELGHGKNWDILLMTVVQLVPFVLYFLYRTAMQMGGRGKDGGYRVAVAVGAYVLYIASEYIVLWFSRCREYYADRFAGEVTGNPNALASALVKIGYGLAARGNATTENDAAETEGKKAKKKKEIPALDAIGAMGIFDRKSAVAMVAASAAGIGSTGSRGIRKENLKSAMQWDLWNPWATFYELHSTHPLVAHRLQYLGEQAAVMGHDPFVVFDRRKPESYWDDFAVDLLVMVLPVLLLLAGLASAAGLLAFSGGAVAGKALWFLIGLPLVGLGAGMLLKTWYTYRGEHFAPLTVAGLLHKVKVSGVRPVPTRMRGTIIGKGVPGLIWSEDFIMQDSTGILFLDYRQPLGIWDWLFGLLRAGQFQGKTVEAVGWFRRSPTPYLELKSITVDGVTRHCYTRQVKYAWAGLLVVAGIALTAMPFIRP